MISDLSKSSCAQLSNDKAMAKVSFCLLITPVHALRELLRLPMGFTICKLTIAATLIVCTDYVPLDLNDIIVLL